MNQCKFVFGPFLLSMLLCSPALTQSELPNSLKAIYAPVTSYYYVKPVAGLFRNASHYRGDSRFGQTYADNLRNFKYGLTIDYHINRLEIETGLLTLPVATGYFFELNTLNSGGPGHGYGHSTKITYNQVPILARFTLWQPTKRLDIRATAGIGINWESGGLTLGSNSITELTIETQDGIKRMTRITTKGDHLKSFRTGTVGLGLHYRFSRHFTAGLEVKRLFSRKDLLWIDAQIEPHGETQKYTVRTEGGVNGFNLHAGLQYQFGFSKKYRLKNHSFN